MFRKFKFEEEVYEKLQTIPLSTLYKLERVGIQLSLESWSKFSHEEKRVLCHLPLRTQGEMDCYKKYLVYLLKSQGEKAEEINSLSAEQERSQWEDLAHIPREVYVKALEWDIIITPGDWIRLDDLERYALFKLSVNPGSKKPMEKALEEFFGGAISKPARSEKIS